VLRCQLKHRYDVLRHRAWRAGAERPLFVGKILKGAEPGDMAVGQAVKVISLKITRTLDLTITLLGRPDEVIESELLMSCRFRKLHPFDASLKRPDRGRNTCNRCVQCTDLRSDCPTRKSDAAWVFAARRLYTATAVHRLPQRRRRCVQSQAADGVTRNAHWRMAAISQA